MTVELTSPIVRHALPSMIVQCNTCFQSGGILSIVVVVRMLLLLLLLLLLLPRMHKSGVHEITCSLLFHQRLRLHLQTKQDMHPVACCVAACGVPVVVMPSRRGGERYLFLVFSSKNILLVCLVFFTNTAQIL